MGVSHPRSLDRASVGSANLSRRSSVHPRDAISARALLALSTTLFAQAPKPLPADDAIRIAEFYRLAEQIQDKIWPGWSKTPAPLLLVTS